MHYIYYYLLDLGHYFSFIYDYSQKQWRKYNDRHVTEVKEEDVLEEAYGFGISSAYSLIYYSESLLNTIINPTNHKEFL